MVLGDDRVLADRISQLRQNLLAKSVRVIAPHARRGERHARSVIRLALDGRRRPADGTHGLLLGAALAAGNRSDAESMPQIRVIARRAPVCWTSITIACQPPILKAASAAMLARSASLAPSGTICTGLSRPTI